MNGGDPQTTSAVQNSIRAPLSASTTSLVRLLRSESLRMVLAESCTSGRAAAALGAIPDISEYFCGSVIAYRDQTKIDLLDVGAEGIEQWTSTSEPVAMQMACSVLFKTSEADYAASITGHLGPMSAECHDGMVYIGLAWRTNDGVKPYQVTLKNLKAKNRLARRDEATAELFEQLRRCILATRHPTE
ncbi:MAG: nicotinamide-nucleotide amidohydrolase family protein [Lacipirellulaceae bacterium]